MDKTGASKNKKSTKLKPFSLLAVGSLATALITFPVCAAERVDFLYGPFNYSVSVDSLEKFATQGKIEPDVALILNRLSSGQKKQLQSILQTRYKVKPMTLHRLGQTYSGHRVLSFFGDVVQLPGGRSGYYGLRSAMFQAAADPKGLTALNLLHKFPTDIQIDVAKCLYLVREATTLIKETSTFVQKIDSTITVNANSQVVTDTTYQDSLLHAKTTETALAVRPSLDLKQLGQLNTFKQTQTFYDTKRNRHIVVDFYLPKTRESQLPIIVISNGLGADRKRFEQLAHHLASHGFAVVIPDHPGSNAQRQREFYQGYYTEPFDATEFVDRPLDITYVLDQLERLNSSQFNNQLNLQKVGIFGNSFGGTTALALAGATINFAQLEKDCTKDKSLINISIVHQCRALELPQKTYQLKDERIKAAFVFVPFGKSLYGRAGMKQVNIPIFWQASDEDLITPLLIEQIPPFTWLATPDKYLSLAKKLPHTRVGLDAMNQLMSRNLSVEKLLQLTQDYLSAFNLAFFKVYVAQDEQYRQYLQQSYANALSEEPYNLRLLKSVQVSNPILSGTK